MRTRILTFVVLASSGCSNIAASVATPMPVLLTRVDRIGGTPLPQVTSTKDDFDSESGSGFWVFYGSAYPVLSASHPSTAPLEQQMREAAALRVGQVSLHQYNLRVTGYRAGAFIHFFGGEYGNYRYWRAFGAMEAK